MEKIGLLEPWTSVFVISTELQHEIYLAQTNRSLRCCSSVCSAGGVALTAEEVKADLGKRKEKKEAA